MELVVGLAQLCRFAASLVLSGLHRQLLVSLALHLAQPLLLSLEDGRSSSENVRITTRSTNQILLEGRQLSGVGHFHLVQVQVLLSSPTLFQRVAHSTFHSLIVKRRD